MRKTLMRGAILGLTLLTAASLSLFAAGNEETGGTQGPATFTFLTHSGHTAGVAEPDNDLPVYQEYEKLTGVRIDWKIVPVENWSEVMSARIAARDLADIINVHGLGDVGDWGAEGLLVPMNEMLDTHAPHTTKWWAQPEYSDHKAYMTSPDGNIYALRSYVIPNEFPGAAMINTEWLDNLGLQMPENTDDLYAVLKAFKEQDPNGNGKADEIPLVSNGYWLRTLAWSFGLKHLWNDGWQVDANGKVYWDIMSENYRTYVEFVARLYTEGLLDKEFLTQRGNQMRQKMGGALIGVFVHQLSQLPNYNPLYPGSAGGTKEVFRPMTPLAGPFGEGYVVERLRSFQGGNHDPTGITYLCEDPERALEWIDFVRSSPQALKLQNYGIAGITYNEVDGQVSIIDDPESSFAERVVALGGGVPPWAYVQWDEASKLRYSPQMLEYDAMYKQYFVKGFPVTVLLPEEAETWSEVAPDLDTYRTEMNDKFMTGQASTDEWDTYIATLRRLGADTLIGIQQAKYDRFVAASR